MTRALLTLLLIGCAESHAVPADAGRRAPDLGECVGLAATLADAGPVAHVYAYPDGHPCGDGGMCRMRIHDGLRTGEEWPVQSFTSQKASDIKIEVGTWPSGAKGSP